MALLDRLLKRNRRPSQMEAATFSFEPVAHASAVRFLELDGQDEAPTVEMDRPPVMDIGYEVPDEVEAEVFLNIAVAAHRDAYLAVPAPVKLAEGSGAIPTIDDGITIDFDDLD
jgi:hypothetical protein